MWARWFAHGRTEHSGEDTVAVASGGDSERIALGAERPVRAAVHGWSPERGGQGDLTRLAGGNKLATRALVPSVPLAIGAPRASVGLPLPPTRSPAASSRSFFAFHSTSAWPVRRSARPRWPRSAVTNLPPTASWTAAFTRAHFARFHLPIHPSLSVFDSSSNHSPIFSILQGVIQRIKNYLFFYLLSRIYLLLDLWVNCLRLLVSRGWILT